MRVFLCDDVADMRLLMRLTLEEVPDLKVVGEADNGASALTAVAESQPDVVLVDLSMPGMDGLDLIPRLRRLAPDTGIVVYTALASPRVEAQAFRRGADRFLKKGAPLERLREVTRQVAFERRDGAAEPWEARP
jgi:DNA-binding NarL/FixJ family response regulator